MKPGTFKLNRLTLRTRLTLYYLVILAVLLLVYAALVFAFQSAVLTRQMLHDEVQDVITVEGLLYFDASGVLQLRQDYYSRPQSHLLVDRMMEVRDVASGAVLYSSPTLQGMSLGEGLRPGEGDNGFDERRVRLADGTHVYVVSHVHGMSGHNLVIRLAYSLGPFHERMKEFLLLLLLAIPSALALAGWAGQVVARRGLRPLSRMTAHAERITAYNLHDRLDVSDIEDELSHMARVFNGLLQRLEEAFFQLQRFTADAAHELRTPLATLRATGEVALQQGRTAEEYRNTLSNILEEGARLSATIDSLLLLARAEQTQPGAQQTVFPMRPLVTEALGVLEILIEEKAIRVVEEIGTIAPAQVRGDRSLIRVAILNILHNAVKFSPPQGVLHIAYVVTEAAPTALCMTFHDAGPGIPRGCEDKIFERFFTGSASEDDGPSGTGLGLAIARLIIERASGSIRFDAAVEIGAKCVVCLPLVS